jgi:hypothetical protein
MLTPNEEESPVVECELSLPYTGTDAIARRSEHRDSGACHRGHCEFEDKRLREESIVAVTSVAGEGLRDATSQR